jgi:L,D-transpeptidase YcbB
MNLRNPRLIALLSLSILFPVGSRPDSISPAPSSSALSLPAPSPRPQQLSGDGEALLRNFLTSGKMADLHRPEFSNYEKDAEKFYDDFGGALPWIEEGNPTAQARAVIASLKQAADKGLDPEEYEGSRWDARLAQFGRSGRVPEPDLVKFDLALTVSTMRYISDLHMGRVNPRLFHFGLDIDQQQFGLSDFLKQRLIAATDVNAVLAAVEPPFPIYQRTQDALKRYIDFARRDDGEQLPATTRPVKPGDAYAGVPRLTRLLALLGDLPAGQTGANAEGNYQGALVEAVKHFQRRHGLAPNGIIDAATLKELNTPLRTRVTQLQLAMERMRWLPHEFSRPPVIVNIPEFRLYALNDKYLTNFTMNVVVGKAYGHQTPVFANAIKSVVFRPYWNVPISIVRAELIPHIEKNPSYLSANSFEIVDKDEKVVVVGEVTKEVIAQLHAGTLRVRQTPGPENALGLIKFEFPNVYDVYMHSTPAKELFSRTRRDFSHGCIRLDDPAALAKWVLRDMPGWDEKSIQAALNGDKTLEARLKEPIPVLIFYSTAVILEGGDDRFFEDIYGLDADLEKALAQANP